MKYYRFLMAFSIHIAYAAVAATIYYVADIVTITKKCYDKYIIKEKTNLAIELFDNCFPD
jgi:hypothetical protein